MIGGGWQDQINNLDCEACTGKWMECGFLDQYVVGCPAGTGRNNTILVHDVESVAVLHNNGCLAVGQQLFKLKSQHAQKFLLRLPR